MRKLPEGYSKAFAQAKAEGRDTFTLNGKTYRTMGGRSHGRSIEETRGGSEKPSGGSSRSSGTRSARTESRASATPSSSSQRPKARPASSGRNSQSVSGDPRTSDGYNRKPKVTLRRSSGTRSDPIGASNPPTQPRTRSLPNSPSATTTAGSMAERSPSQIRTSRLPSPDPSPSRPRAMEAYQERVRNRQLGRFPKITAEILSQLSETQKRTLEANGSVTFRGQRYSK